MSEKNIQSEIMLELSKRGILVWRNQVGTFRALHSDGIIKIGQAGQPDLMAIMEIEITQEMVGKKLGTFVSIEVKAQKGIQAKQQKLWQFAVEKRHCKYKLCRTVQDAVDLITENIGK